MSMSLAPTVSTSQRMKRGQIRALLERRAGIEEMAGMAVRNHNRRDFQDGNLQVEENKTLRLGAQVEENPAKGKIIRRPEEEQTQAQKIIELNPKKEMQAEEIISLNPKPMEIADVIVLRDAQQNLKYIWLVRLDAVGDATRND